MLQLGMDTQETTLQDVIDLVDEIIAMRPNGDFRSKIGDIVNPDRHADGTRTITLRVSGKLYNRLQIARFNNRSPRPHDTVGSYVKWFLETQFLRKR